MAKGISRGQWSADLLIICNKDFSTEIVVVVDHLTATSTADAADTVSKEVFFADSWCGHFTYFPWLPKSAMVIVFGAATGAFIALLREAQAVIYL